MKKQGLESLPDTLRRLDLKVEKDYRCQCQTVRHPLNAVVPNCVSCGLILCVKSIDKSSTCPFCDVIVASKEQQQDYVKSVKSLRQASKEKNEQIASKQRFKTHQQPKLYSGMPAAGSVQNTAFPTIQEAQKDAQEQIERQDIAYEMQRRQAEKNKETMLNYDRTSAQRTRIIDQAQDFNRSQKQKKQLLSIDLKGKRTYVEDVFSLPSKDEEEAEAIELRKQNNDKFREAGERNLKGVNAIEQTSGTTDSSGGGYKPHPFLKRINRPIYRPNAEIVE